MFFRKSRVSKPRTTIRAFARGRWKSEPAARPGQSRSCKQNHKLTTASTWRHHTSITRLNRCYTSRMEKPMIRATKSGIFSPDMGHCPSLNLTYDGLCRTVKLSPKTPDGRIAPKIMLIFAQSFFGINYTCFNHSKSNVMTFRHFEVPRKVSKKTV